MKKRVILLFISVIGVSSAYAGDFVLSSPQVQQGAKIADNQVFNGFGCSGGNISPALRWKGAPKGTKSYAITLYDPDAPTGSGWWHWVIFNIPAGVNRLPAGASDTTANRAPKGSIQSRTDFGKPGYGGPCPPAGDNPHHYEFVVYALDTELLPLDQNAPAAMVGFYLQQHLIDKATLTAHFFR